MSLFDLCVITASSSSQAQEFRSLIRKRIDQGLYPREVDFRVYSDPDQGRVGSGGGTLLALWNLLHDSGGSDPTNYFGDRRILMIHAGGESRRLPCYVPEGKLFAPIPVDSSSIIPPVVLDMQLSIFFKYPWRKGEVVVTSGDVIIDFDTVSLPDERGDICGFATAATLEQGSRHGVFKFDRSRHKVESFYQKAPVEFLAEHAALEGTRECALDMGIVSLSPAAISAFFEAGDIAENDSCIIELVRAGKIRFDLYFEIMTAALKGLSFESFLKRVTGESSLSKETLRQLFRIFNYFDLTAVLTRSTLFLHMGSLADFMQSCMALHNKDIRPFYSRENDELRIICTPELIIYNCANFNIPLGRHKPVFAESITSATVENVLGSNMLLGLAGWHSDMTIPEGICIDQRLTSDGPVKLVYGIDDTFKVQRSLELVYFCGIPLSVWLEQRALTPQDIWTHEKEFDLLTAALFAPDTTDEFLAGYWSVPIGTQWTERFRSIGRFSIRQINDLDSMQAREQRRIDIRTRQLRDQIRTASGWINISRPDFSAVFAGNGDRNHLESIYQKTDDGLLRAYRRALLDAVAGEHEEREEEPGFDVAYVSGHSFIEGISVDIKKDQIVWARSPVRLDLAGGWSDTPPYTLRNGGAVVNLAVDLNGQPPIQVFCRRTEEHHIRIHSIDLGVTETITSFTSLSDYRNPTSPFALPRAALCLLGFTPELSGARGLNELLARLGCGLELTLLCAVPKGSGLGTSSILGATILGCLYRFFGRRADTVQLFRQVLQMEQMLTTGGGWQDQIGGVIGGVKYIESKPGLRPDPVVHQLDPALFLMPENHSCFTLFYTGITRLAKNILGEVVAQVNGTTAAYLFTLNHIRQLALDGREAISLRDLTKVAEIISQSWESNIRVHAGSSNEEISNLLKRTRPLYRGAKLLGAGGGGYALFVSDSPKQAGELRELLRGEFENELARIVEFSLNQPGMQITVS